MNYFDNLITHERNLSLGLQSSLVIHSSAFNFSPFGGWHGAFLWVVRFYLTVTVGSAISAGVTQKLGAPVGETTCNDPGHFFRYPLSPLLSVIPDGSFFG